MIRPTRLLPCALLLLLAACTREPNVRKQKYLDSGNQYFAQNKFGEAVIQYRNAIKIDAKFADAHYKLSQAYLQLRDARDAYDELNRTVALAPDNFTAHTDLANLLMATHNPENLKEAKAHLDILLDKQPNRPETHQAWATYDSSQNNIPAAIGEMQKAVALDPNRSQSYVLLALFQTGANQPDQAEANFKKAVAVDPKDMSAQLGLGGFYQSRNRLADAEQQFRHAMDVDPNNLGPRLALVRLLMSEGKKDETEAVARQTRHDLPNLPDAYRMLGDFYFNSGDLNKASAEYASLLNDHPKDLQVKKNYIQILILQNRIDDAAKLNDEILKANSHDVEAHVYQGEIQLRRNDTAGAITSLQAALNDDHDNAIAHYQLGVAYNQQRQSDHAIAEWRQAVALQPGLVDAQRYLAAAEKEQSDYDALLQTAQQIIAAQPSAPDGYLFKCVAEIGRQKFSDAQQDAQSALERAPQSPQPYLQMGNIHFEQRKFDKAESFYQQALTKDPSLVEGLSRLMSAYLAQGQADKAIAAARAQIAKVPDSSGFYDLLGTVLFNAHKDFPNAEAALRKALELDRNNTDAQQKLGEVLVAEGHPDQALALYQQALKDNPSNVAVYILSGEIYETRQDWDDAKKMYQQALAIVPDHPLASNNLAYVMLQQGGNVDLALSMAQTARRGMPDSPNAADTLGWAYYQKGVYPSAISQFQEALKLAEKRGQPDDPTVHYHLGLAYGKANQTSQARQQFEKAVKLKPDYPDAKKALSDLRG